MKRPRRPDLHLSGPFFSTSGTSGAPSSAYRSMGQTDGVPWDTNIPGLDDFLGTISTLQVPALGTFTPWGKFVPAPTPLGYQIMPLSAPPDTNILCFQFSEVAQLLASLGFAQPAFLAILTTQPLRPDDVAVALRGTPYGLFDAPIAVYAQADPSGIPTMMFFYWIRLRDPGDPEGGSESVSSAAGSVGGALLFAQQVPVETSTSRQAPVADVSAVASVQQPLAFTVPQGPPPGPPQENVEPPVQQPAPPPVTTPVSAAEAPSVGALLGVAALAGALGIGAVRAFGGKRRR